MKKDMFSKIVLLTFFAIFILTASNMNGVGEEKVETHSPEVIEASYSINSLSDSVGPIIGLPTLNITDPDSDEPVNVTAPVNDVDGVQNGTLYWTYTTINSTVFSSTVNSTRVVFVDETLFERTGYISNTGVEIGASTDRRFGEFIYESSESGVVSEVDLTIEAAGGGDVLVYVCIKALNITTDEWELILEVGNKFGGIADIGPVSYTNTDTNLTAGYEIYAITYDAGIPSDPTFNPLRLYQNQCSWDIPAPNEPTFVDYYIKAFDDKNQTTTGSTHTLLMDTAPIVIIRTYPTDTISTDDDIDLEISVHDSDGLDTINHSSVFVYWWLSGDTDFNVVELTYVADLTGDSWFTCTIPASNLGNIETYLYVMANASDIVDGQRGREDYSPTRYIRIDSLHPQIHVNGITIDGGVSVVGLENVTLTTSVVNITVDFYDDYSGVKSAVIYYSMPNGSSWIKEEMTNTTDTGRTIDDTTFFVTLPATDETAFVDYFFETTDFLDNKGNLSVNFYHADGDGPLLDALLIYPEVISNYTATDILFNSSDYSGQLDSVLWYSIDNGTNWNNQVPQVINYGAHVDSFEQFNSVNLPYLIEDNSVSLFPLEVVRTTRIDTASLYFWIDHEMPTDIRVWLKLKDGRKYIIFDRESGSTTIQRTIDLFSLGLVQDDFTNNTFTLEVQDFSVKYSGLVRDFWVYVEHHDIPLGYQYLTTIPATNIDTTVLFYITMTDNIWNAKNTSTYEYYSDGLSPNISIIEPLETVLELEGRHNVRIIANATDLGGIFGVDTYYKYLENDPWIVIPMSLNTTTGFYYSDVPVLSENGSIIFKVRVYDLSGLSSETNVSICEFKKALAPVITVHDAPFPSSLDLQGARTIRIITNVTDDGSVENVTIVYHFNANEKWTAKQMLFDENEGYYYIDIAIPITKGNFTFFILATDNLDLIGASVIYTIDYENGTVDPATSETEDPGFPLEMIGIGALIALGLAGVGIGLYFLYDKLKGGGEA